MRWSIENIKDEEINPSNGLARYRKFDVNGKILETPALFASHWLGGIPSPWEIEGFKTYLVNAYDIYSHNQKCTEMMSKGIHTSLAAQYPSFKLQDAIILMDSGGFSLFKTVEDLKREEKKLEKKRKTIENQTLLEKLLPQENSFTNLDELKSIEKNITKVKTKLESQTERIHKFSENLNEMYAALKPDLAVTLDYPFDPKINDSHQRYEFSKKNILEMASWKISIGKCRLAILPVIHPIAKEILADIYKKKPHANPPSTFSFADDCQIRNAIKDVPAIGIGSLIPLLMHRAGGGREEVIKFLFDLRTKYYPNKFIHAFGVGGTTTMHLAYYLGCDSVDCAGWRRRAIYGIVQLPGTGDRYVTEKTRERLKWKGIPFLKGEELAQFENCNCPAHKEGYTTMDFDVKTPKSFERRAIHNLYVYVKEVNEAQVSIQKGEFESFVKNRLGRSKVHRKLFKFAKKRVKDFLDQKRQQKALKSL